MSLPYLAIASAYFNRGIGVAMSTPMHVLKTSTVKLLHHAENVVDLDERHLHVELRELGLAVGAEVFVPQAAGDLEVAVEARDHQELFVKLRGLGEGEELAVVDAAGHEVVARPFRRALAEQRRFYFQETRGRPGSLG